MVGGCGLGGGGSERMWSNVCNGTSTLQGVDLCQIIQKSMQKCRSYGTDKLNL